MRICLTLLLMFTLAPLLYADESLKVAMIEFQNDSGTIVITNRWTMAEDLGKRLRKKNKNIQILSRKEILKNVKDLSWNGERLALTQEKALLESGAKYVVYGSIVHWRAHGIYSNPQVQDALEANVIFEIRVIDLTTGNFVKSFTVDGASTGETGYIREGDPAVFVDENSREEMYEATEVATMKAADILSEIVSK